MDSYAFEANFERIIAIGLVSEGARLDTHTSGSVTDGPLTGWRVENTDYLLMRHDGTSVMDIRGVTTGPAGEAVSTAATGYVVPPGPMPPLESMLAADFDWPDLDLPLHGSARFTTSLPELRTLNSTMYAFTGTVNVGLGRVRVQARPIVDVLAPPA